VLCGEGTQQVDHRLIGGTVLRCETRHGVAEIGSVERGVLIYGAGSKSFAERVEWDETDSELLNLRQDGVLGLTPPMRLSRSRTPCTDKPSRRDGLLRLLPDATASVVERSSCGRR
jgi:hypothetical protein